MKNKEIEELLNDMRHSYEIHEEIIKKYNNADKISYPYTINLKQIDLLLSYIEQLENNRDKAIEYVESHFIFNDKTGECYQTHTFDKDNVKKLYDILKGGSDE